MVGTCFAASTIGRCSTVISLSWHHCTRLATCNRMRCGFSGLRIPGSRWARLIDPRAAIAQDITLGLGSIVGPFVTIDTETTVGAHSYVRPSAVVGHAAKIGDFVYVGPNTVICSFSCIECGAHIAPGAVVRGDVRVGRFAIVGLGAVVTKDVRDYAVVVGNPAREQGEVERIDIPCLAYDRAR